MTPNRLLRIKMAVAGVLGDWCAICGRACWWPWETEDPEFAGDSLQVGHPNGRKWSIRAVNQITRWRRYLKEAIAGKVQAECGPCNRKHGGSLRYAKKDKTRQGAPKRRKADRAEEMRRIQETARLYEIAPGSIEEIMEHNEEMDSI